jgi:serine/threonine-protein kinase
MNGRELLAGRYELRGVLGRGGMAEVHEGWDIRLDRAVAVKLLYPVFAADPVLRCRFEAEARAAAGLNHPNIVSVHDSGDHGGTPFIVMERLPGLTLADVIAQGPMPPERVRTMLRDVLGALDTAHAAGIVHRDIKPGNVLVAPTGITMKVADFGIAKTAGAAHTATGQVIGTMAYMSPARVAGAPASVADDLYALGVMAYEALTAQRAYPQENPAALVRAILYDPPPPICAMRPDVDFVMGEVIDRAMARDTGRRYSSADQMRAALAGTLPSRSATKVLAEPVPASTSHFVPVQARRKPMSLERKLLLGAGALVALSVTAVALAVDPSPTSQPTAPVSGSTTVAPPAPTPLPPAPTAAPVVEKPTAEPGEGRKGGDKKGNQGNGNGNKKHG